jgi:hypothetical protein
MGRSGWMTKNLEGSRYRATDRYPINGPPGRSLSEAPDANLHAGRVEPALGLVGLRELVSHAAANFPDLGLQVGFRDALLLAAATRRRASSGLVLGGFRSPELLCGVNAVFNPEVDEPACLAHLSLPTPVDRRVVFTDESSKTALNALAGLRVMERLSKMIGGRSIRWFDWGRL